MGIHWGIKTHTVIIMIVIGSQNCENGIKGYENDARCVIMKRCGYKLTRSGRWRFNRRKGVDATHKLQLQNKIDPQAACFVVVPAAYQGRSTGCDVS